MTLEKAIKLLEKEYEKAKGLECVYNPLAYALYKVWKMADSPRTGGISDKTKAALEKMGRKAHGGE